MKKVAIFSRGTDASKEDSEKGFHKYVNTDLEIMSGIAKSAGYNVIEVPLSEVSKEMRKYSCSDIMVYYSGHGEQFFSGYDKDILDSVNNFSGDKKVILDACCGDELEKIVLSKGSLIVGANEVPFSKSIAKILWDYTVPRKNNLDNLSQESFYEMKHGWINAINH